MREHKLTNRLARGIALSFAGVLLAACYSYQAPHLDQVETEPEPRADYRIAERVENIVFTPGDWPEPLRADLYLPDRRGAMPVVIVVHGGGWANRGRDDMADISEKLAQHGYAVFNVNYRLAPRYRFPAQLEDMRAALAWLHDNAARYRLDLARVNTWGFSSGAHLAALLASAPYPSDAADLPRIRAVVAGGIPSDLRKYAEGPIVERFMGGKRDEMPRRYAEASPAYHVSPDDPPVFLYHGKLDWLVGDDQAIDYYNLLVANDVPAELYLHRWRGHMTLFLFGDDAENRAIDFLNRNNV